MAIKYLDLTPARGHRPRSIGKESEINRFLFIRFSKIAVGGMEQAKCRTYHVKNEN